MVCSEMSLCAAAPEDKPAMYLVGVRVRGRPSEKVALHKVLFVELRFSAALMEFRIFVFQVP